MADDLAYVLCLPTIFSKVLNIHLMRRSLVSKDEVQEVHGVVC
jgi:hypothetical protein